MKNLFKNKGPAAMVAAAFIGPGTVTVCTIAGVQFGYSLLWAMLISIIGTLILQEMAGRVGLITQKGLATVIKDEIKVPYLRTATVILIVTAIFAGNIAYESGNMSGAILGLEALFGDLYTNYYLFLVFIFSFFLLFFGSYKILERSLVILVLLMSLSFIVSAAFTGPSILSLFKGLFVPQLEEASLLTVVSLIGTTIVPYNLFLHASLVKEKWKSKNDLKAFRSDTLISIFIGGIISICIIISAASLYPGQVNSVLDLASGLEPLYGRWARYFLGTGLFAAGITSAVTAPLATSYVVKSCLGWEVSMRDFRFRLVWMIVLFAGCLFLFFEVKPIKLIQFAQLANGILLPVIAVFLLWVVNRTSIMEKYTNTIIVNIISILIIILTIFLGIKSVIKVLELY